MLNKKIQAILLIFTAIVLISTTCFATNDSDNSSQEQAVEITETTPTNEEDNVLISQNGEESKEETEDQTQTESLPNEYSATGATEPKNGDIYQVGEDIEITDIINGNMFIKANTLTITSQVGGDVFVIADKINIDGGQIYGNVFAIANEITVNGLVYDLYAMCKKLTVSYDGTFYRDLRAVSEDVTINGVVYGNANIITSSSLTLENDCIIRGNLYYSNPTEIEVQEGLVEGEVNYKPISESTNNNTSSMIWIGVFFLVFVLFVWAFMSYLMPEFTKRIALAGKNKPILSLIIGLIGIIAIPFIAFLLLLTVIGIPISICLFMLYALIIALSFTLTTISLSSILANKVEALSKGKNILAVIIIAVILIILSYIPYVNVAVSALTLLYGFGLFLLALFNKAEKKNKE